MERASEQPADVVGAPRGPHLIERLAELRFAVALLIGFGAALFFATLGDYPLYTKGETREAETVYEIASGGGLILPMRAGVEVPSKPPLMHWLAALASLVSGQVNEPSVRFPSALFAVGGIVACYLYGRVLFNPVAAFTAALMLGTAFQYLQAGTAARVDMTLTFFMEVAFFEFLMIAEGLTQRRMLLYAAVALAVLSKGPVGFVLPAATALLFIAIRRRWDLLRELRLARGAMLVAVLAGGWYVAATWIGGREFIDRQILTENVFRLVPLADSTEGHEHPFYYLVLMLLAGLLPWTLLAPVAIAASRSAPVRLDARILYLLLWSAVVLGFYSFAHSKRGAYLLAMYPALALLLGVQLAAAMRNSRGAGALVTITSRVGGMGFVFAGALGAVSIALALVWPETLASLLAPFGVRAPGFAAELARAFTAAWALVSVLIVATIAVGAYLLRWRPSVERLVMATAGGFAFAAIAVNLVVLPALGHTLGLKRFTADAMRAIGESSAGYLQALNYGVAFYSGRNFPIVRLRDLGSVEYVIAWKRSYDALSAERRAGLELMLTSNPTELDGDGAMVLLRKVRAGESEHEL